MVMTEKSRKITRQRNKRNRFRAVLLLVLGILCLAALGFSARRFFAEIYADVFLVTPIVWEDAIEGDAVFLRPEAMAAAPFRGVCVRLLQEGDRVSKGTAVARLIYYEGTSLENRREIEIMAPESGIVSFSEDGLESVYAPDGVMAVSLEDMMKLYQKKDKNASLQVEDGDIMIEAGEMVFKIIDNLSSAYVYMETDRTDIVQEAGAKMTLRLADMPEQTVKAAGIQKSPRGTYILLEAGQVPEGLNRRVYSGTLVLDRVEKTLLPDQVIVSRKAQTGVYVLEDGFVRWKPVHVLERQPDQVVIAGLDGKAWVVSRPFWVWEGMQLRSMVVTTRRE
jgi:putative membrane fusion protein